MKFTLVDLLKGFCDSSARAALAAVSSGRQFVESRLSLTREAQAVLAEAEWGSPAEDDDEEKDVSEDGRVLKSNIVGYPVSDDEDNSKVDTLPNELVELKRQLNYLKNEFSQVSEAQKNVESEPLSLPEGQQQLQNKLRELQDKKSRMDALLHELQLLQSQPMDNLRNNESNPLASQISPSLVASNIPAAGQQSQTSVRSQVPVTLQGWMNEMPALAAAAAESSNYASTAKDTGKKHDQGNTQQELVSEVQEKLKRLKEVRGQLDELRKLVQYYQGENQDGDPDDQSSLPGFSDAGDQTSSSKDQGRLMGATGMRVPPQQQQSQQQLLDLLQMSQQQKRQAAEGGGGAATRTSSSSLQNMVQLLNLAGTDQGDELSDEDNVSVSQSDSQWSHIGPAWDEDPEIREKVRKLKAAKEKLRQLQDLVSFVQQSPDGSRAMPENLSDLVAIVEGEAVTQATQTEETNVSVSEGEVASDSHKLQQRQEAEGNENPREELERLKKERKMLLDIQNQLQHIQTQVGRPSTEQERNVQERQRQESNPNLVNGGQEQSSTAPVVTCRYLTTQTSLYCCLMSHSVPASVDATMATWGGSTVDNLENITEDEDAQKRIERVDGDEDDGYPSDGIVQVEEEEEENDSDNETYTIEADAKQRRTLRKGINNNSGARPKTSRGRQSFPQPVYGAKETTKKQINGQRSQRSQRVSKHRQENYRSAQDLLQDDDDEDDDADSREKTSEWFSLINERLKELAGSVESLRKPESEHRQLSVSLNQDSGQQTGTLYSPMQEQMLQLQNQSMMLSFGQLIQSLTRQQTEMQQLQQQMQALQLQMNEIHDQSYHNVASQSQQYLRPAMCNPSLNNSTYNLQAPSQPLVINQQLSSPYLQGHLNSTASNGLFGGYLSPGLRNIHQTNLPASGLAANADGAAFGGLGSGLSINTGSGSSLAQPNAVTGFIFNPLGQTSLTRHLSPHVDPLSQQSSVSTMTRDFSQFVNTLNSPSASQGAAYGQFNNLHLFGSRKMMTNAINYIQMICIPLGKIFNRPVSSQLKYRKISSRSESNTSSNLKLSRENVQNLSTRSSTASQNWASHRSAQYTGATAGTQYDMAAGQALRDDCRSSCSSIQSIRDQHSRLKEEQSQTASVDAADDSNTLFDTLRDTIYSEVASLISQNESRPHFLLEIFREMQQIDSDLQRQRALYSIQEILRSHIEANGGAPTQNLSEAERTSAGRKVARGGAPRNYSFDYAEVAENPSSLSTPTNDCEESPFFQDALGETVIEFDSLRHDDREEHLTGWRNCGTYEQQMWENGGFLPFDKFRESQRKSQSSLHKTLKEETQSSASQSADLEELAAGEEGASAYVSDMPYPRINMKQLDKQIKEVMMETIPLVKQHMSDVCSTQLLNYIKQLVLSLTSQVGHEEFAKFFQRQLSSILQDTLQKYHGRKMKECGEDLLVEISDVLFNELAFFRLMQDLEDGSAGDRVRLTEWTGQYPTEVSKSSSTYSNDGSGSSEAEDDDKDEDTKNNEEDNETNLRDSEDKEDIEMESYQIELAPSETKPFTRIGSDEDDDEGDEEQSMDDPSETAVSRDSRMEVNGHTQPCVPSSARPETEGAGGDVAEKQDAEKLSPKKVVSTIVLKATGAGDQGETQPQTQVNGSVTPNDVYLDTKTTRTAYNVRLKLMDDCILFQPGLRWNYEEEQRSVYGIDAIISSLDDVNELAGEDNLDPESFQS
uniref:Pericentriolar material 1 protein C-terminal domain-containing protein n=1 Tax=Biomphalaria glabrata TaxID=6526 RepID=A0A2C9LJ14_BIOGL